MFEHPDTGNKDPYYTITIIVLSVTAAKFLFEGVSLTLWGHIINLGHADAATYMAVLAPVLGAHGYMSVNKKKGSDDGSTDSK